MTPKQALLNQTTYPTTLTTAEEKKGNSALKAALDLHERGAKSGWAQPGAKDRALDAYMQSAEVCVLGASLQQKLAGRRFFHQTTIFCSLSFWKPYPMCYPKKSSARPTANHKSTRLKLVSFLPFFFWPLHCLVGVVVASACATIIGPPRGLAVVFRCIEGAEATAATRGKRRGGHQENRGEMQGGAVESGGSQGGREGKIARTLQTRPSFHASEKCMCDGCLFDVPRFCLTRRGRSRKEFTRVCR